MHDKDDLTTWWLKISGQDVDNAAGKAEEYGSADLEIMGQAMQGLYLAATQNGPGEETTDSETLRRVGLEMAIAFYNLGKAARMFGAYTRGTVPSDDTWHDAVVYPMMARRVRDTGRWP